jgi:hypothetical protein
VTSKRAEEYRLLARECLQTARTVSTAKARATLLKMAETWERLAEEQEAAQSKDHDD